MSSRPKNFLLKRYQKPHVTSFHKMWSRYRQLNPLIWVICSARKRVPSLRNINLRKNNHTQIFVKGMSANFSLDMKGLLRSTSAQDCRQNPLSQKPAGRQKMQWALFSNRNLLTPSFQNHPRLPCAHKGAQPYTESLVFPCFVEAAFPSTFFSVASDAFSVCVPEDGAGPPERFA